MEKRLFIGLYGVDGIADPKKRKIDKFEDTDELEEIKIKTWDWQQELAKFLPEV